MGKNLAETVKGSLVLAVALVFLYLFINTAQVSAVEGYKVSATFAKIGGLQKGSDVRIDGITNGSISSTGLNAETYDTVVSLSIKPSIKLPKDTVATNASEGMIGGKIYAPTPRLFKGIYQAGWSDWQNRRF